MERDFHSASHPTSRICEHSSHVTMHLVQRMWLSPLVPQSGLEPPTRGFSVLCYYQLSYRGIYKAQMKYLLELNQRQIV